MEIDAKNAVKLLSPRLFALITTTSEDSSTNASPYSWVFPFSFSPPMLMIGTSKGKHTQENAEREGEFVVNLVSEDFGQKACDLEALHGENQLDWVGLEEIDSKKVKVKGVKEARIRLECKLIETIEPKKGDHVFLVGEIVSAECSEMSEAFPDLDKLNLLMHVSGPEFRKIGEKVALERKKAE